jgi:hypothetical protein
MELHLIKILTDCLNETIILIKTERCKKPDTFKPDVLAVLDCGDFWDLVAEYDGTMSEQNIILSNFAVAASEYMSLIKPEPATEKAQKELQMVRNVVVTSPTNLFNSQINKANTTYRLLRKCYPNLPRCRLIKHIWQINGLHYFIYERYYLKSNPQWLEKQLFIKVKDKCKN